MPVLVPEEAIFPGKQRGLDQLPSAGRPPLTAHHSGSGFPFVSGANTISTSPTTYTPATTAHACA